MSFFEIIGAIIFGPLKLLFEIIFLAAYKVIMHPGPAIIVLSLAMNILALPLYRRADDIQIKARDTENKLRPVVTHIRKTFSGDERMMILQTYYRQNHYNPLSVLSGSISLMLEIPFFVAAYQFLSGLVIFQGVSFGPIRDLSLPDRLLQIGDFSVNLLPIIMTLVNIVSSSLYLKGFPLKSKIQLYGMAGFFLVFLYNSPAALVFYWTLNNLFSLVKTIFYRIKNAKTVLNVFLGTAGVAAVFLGIRMDGFWRSVFMICLGIVVQLPWIISLIKRKMPGRKLKTSLTAPDTALFVTGALFMTALVGLLIPSTYISASTQEFIDVSYFYNPVWYVVKTLCLAAGMFLVWLGVFYWLADSKGKVFFSRLVWIASGVMLVNYMFFGTRLGILSPELRYTNGFYFSSKEQLINICTNVLLITVLLFVCVRFPRKLSSLFLVGVITLTTMGLINTVKIAEAAKETRVQVKGSEGDMPSFSLSKDGKNVVVIMLDRGIGPFIPYIMEEKPELLEKFDGFTYYSNTLSYGGTTNFAAPALYGGYDYTPLEINLRDTESLAEKHNEALKVMPTLFAECGYEATMIDPSYAGYKLIPDVSIFDGMEYVSAYLAAGRFDDNVEPQLLVETRMRNFFFFSMMKCLPVPVQPLIYTDGTYRALPTAKTAFTDENVSLFVKEPSFMRAYSVMQNMKNMTVITEDASNNFMMLRSDLTHEPTILQEPFYEPSLLADNSAFYTEQGKTITAGENTWILDREYTISHYHVNMAAMIQLANWFDFLRQAEVYDNTRIIVVSDHGRDMASENGVYWAIDMHDIYVYQPMLMVKDFNATGYTSCDTFMTNADVPYLAVEGLIQDAVNPFTGNPIDSGNKKEQTQYVFLSDEWDVETNNGTQFLPDEWATVSGTVGDIENWDFHFEKTVFPPRYN